MKNYHETDRTTFFFVVFEVVFKELEEHYRLSDVRQTVVDRTLVYQYFIE